MPTIRQTIDTPHPMYVTMESAVDSATGSYQINNLNNKSFISNISITHKYMLTIILNGLTFLIFTKTAKLVRWLEVQLTNNPLVFVVIPSSEKLSL